LKPANGGFISRRLFTTSLAIELCILYSIRLPLLLSFNNFAFWDWGGYLVSHYLFQRGQAPIADFGWIYGLLPFFLQELWFRLIRASPASFTMLSIPFALAFTIAIDRFVKLESKAAGHCLLLLSLPFIVALGADLPHCLEPALLSVGLLLQAQRRREQALAFAAAACFTKPTMGYLYGLSLLVFIVLDLHRHGKLNIGAFARALLPAACTGVSLAFVLGITFGWVTLFSSLLPLNGARAYRVLHEGWSGTAWQLFYFPGVRLTYYIGTPVTFWLISTCYLMVAGAFAGRRIVQTGIRGSDNCEIVLTCALLHAGFLGFFYGPPASWTYYAYILMMGVAATDDWGRASTRLVWSLCILAAVGNYGTLKSSIVAWRTMKRSAVTAGLFALPAESAEWQRVALLLKDDTPVLFTWTGGAEVLFPWLRKPVGAFIAPGVASNTVIQRKASELHFAHALIIPTIPELGNPLTNWTGPEFQTVLDGTEIVFEGVYFKAYLRHKDR
jgi:hypothetical protein